MTDEKKELTDAELEERMSRALFGSEASRTPTVALSHRYVLTPGRDRPKPRVEVQPRHSGYWWDDMMFDFLMVIGYKRVKTKIDLYEEEARRAVKEYRANGADVVVLPVKRG
ncbi:hypothetical protein AB4144_23120 [Rhizobiaceae sp. 2RAB30]